MFQLLESLNMAKKTRPTTYNLVVSKPKLKAGSDFHSKGLRMQYQKGAHGTSHRPSVCGRERFLRDPQRSRAYGSVFSWIQRNNASGRYNFWPILGIDNNNTEVVHPKISVIVILSFLTLPPG